LIPIVTKLLASTIFRRLTPFRETNIREQQAEFRPGRGCIDQIFTVRNTHCRPTVVVFLDLKAAFESVCDYTSSVLVVVRNNNMEVELLENAGDPVKLKEIVHTKRVSEIVELTANVFQQENPESDINLLEALTYGVREHEELLEICEYTIDCLWSINLSGDYRNAVSFFLGGCIEYLEDWKIERLCFRIIQRLKEESLEKHCIFELFGKALMRLEKSSVILTPLTQPLCAAEWNSENAVAILEALKDYPFSLTSREAILLKTLRILDTADKTMHLVVQHICSYLVTERRTQHALVHENMVNHIYDLCNESEQFGSSMLHALKNLPPELKLAESVLAISLVVIPIETMRNSVLRSTCVSIRDAVSDNLLVSASSFLRGVCNLRQDPAFSLLHLCQQCVDTRHRHMARGLILLGFGLMRMGIGLSASHGSSGIRASRAKAVQRATKPNVSPFTSINSTGPRLVRLGDLLADLVALCPMEVACRAARFDSILDSIGLLPQELAIGLVHAFLPLIRAGSLLTERQTTDVAVPMLNVEPTGTADHPISRVRSRLFTTLRKAASSPRVQSRRNAVACFLLLLKHLKVSVSAFRSASQNSSGSLSQFSMMTQTQATQNNPGLLFTQLQSTQIARQAVTLPCDVAQNEAFCTEIVSVLHRIIFSAFFRSQTGSMLEDPENRVKSEICWGLCEVVTRNRGLVEPVITLYVRLLAGCLSPGFLRNIKQTNGLASLTVPTVLEPGTSQAPPYGTSAVLPLSLDRVVQITAETGEIHRTEHPVSKSEWSVHTTHKRSVVNYLYPNHNPTQTCFRSIERFPSSLTNGIVTPI
uniref:Reverse transcriptase domain-containing protein n=1 Tax=Echinostoma caproni TaxID=27848 RepID=A0A183AUF1_9TREM